MSRRALAAVLSVATIARIAWAMLVPVIPVSDSHAYDVLARNLAFHGLYGWEAGAPSAYWPVGTSFLYSLAYRLFGHDYRPIVVLNVALGVAIVALTMVIARRSVGARAATVAGAMVAIWPTLVEFTTVLASELPFISLVLAALAVWGRSGPPSPGRSAATGALLAAAAYVRPTALLLPLVFAVIALARASCPLRFVVARSTVVVAVLLVCIAPWSLRNTRVFGQFVLLSTNGGANSWMGNNPHTTGAYMPEPSLDMNEAERDAHLGALARRFVRDEPLAFLSRTAWKLLRLHDGESIGVAWNQRGLAERFSPKWIAALKIAGHAFWWLALASALAGAAWLASARRWGALLVPGVCWGYFAAVHAVTVIQDRYHLPSIPFIATLGAVTLSSVARAGVTRACPGSDLSASAAPRA